MHFVTGSVEGLGQPIIGCGYVMFVRSNASCNQRPADGNILMVDLRTSAGAGHDTTANTLACAMLLLTTHPDVQLWLAGEIAAVQTILKGDDVLLEGWG